MIQTQNKKTRKEILQERMRNNPLLLMDIPERNEALSSGSHKAALDELEIAMCQYCFPQIFDLSGAVNLEKDTSEQQEQLDSLLFVTKIIESLKSWNSEVEDGKRAEFWNYAFSNYQTAKKHSLGMEAVSNGGVISRRVYEILCALKEIMEPDGNLEKAILILKNNPKFSGVRESTWRTVRTVFVNQKALSLNENPEGEDDDEKLTLEETVGTICREIEGLCENPHCLDRFMDTLWVLVDPQRTKVKQRVYMKDISTFFMLQPLKMNGTEPYLVKPACDEDIYLTYRNHEEDLMENVFSKGLLEDLMEEEEGYPLSTLRGVGWNFLKSGVRFQQKYLTGYWKCADSMTSNRIKEFKKPFQKVYARSLVPDDED